MSPAPRPFDALDTTDTRHGTANGYNNCACRCDRCRAVHTTARAARRNARPTGIGFISYAAPLPVTPLTTAVARTIAARFPDEPQLLAMLGIAA